MDMPAWVGKPRAREKPLRTRPGRFNEQGAEVLASAGPFELSAVSRDDGRAEAEAHSVRSRIRRRLANLQRYEGDARYLEAGRELVSLLLVGRINLH